MDIIKELENIYGCICLPRGLYDVPQLKGLSGEALYLYGLLVSAQHAGIKTGPDGNPCVHMTTDTVRELLHCGKDKASRVRHELEENGLIFTKRTATGHTYTYVL